MSISLDDITAVILAGGMGSRMGGIDKGLRNFKQAPLALHALMRLSSQVGIWPWRPPCTDAMMVSRSLP